ncbi:MAG TPA: chemotaxis protein CheB [Terriglobales bacterium]|nr:chemotaxis protein CheB [Terriglobales bacterium]
MAKQAGAAGGHTTAAIIAIGASAGGLNAIAEVLGPISTSLPCPIVVVLHVSPRHTSHAAEVLARETRLEVKQACDQEPVRNAVVYIAPPDFHLTIEGGAVRLLQTAAVRFSRPSIDSMFRSIATSYREHAVGVVLSGSGADGADGVRAIKAAGGFIIVQDPNTAQFSSMPHAAMATSCADRILPLAEIGPLINCMSATGAHIHCL